jgi:xylulokinase
MSYMLGLDVGTSGVKAVLVSEDGVVIAAATQEYPSSTPLPLWSEQNPADWWRSSRHALKQVVTEAGVPGEAILGLGLTGQMHGSVFLDERNAVIRPAILWNDGRTEPQCEQITQRIGEGKLIQISGNPALTGFQAPKVLWLREHEPENYNRVQHLLLPKDYIRLQLTGDYATDASDAAGTLLLDIARRKWSNEILDALEIPGTWLPRVYESTEATGHLNSTVAGELGLPPGVQVIAGASDNAAAATGTGVIREGIISSSIGTSGVLFAHIDNILLDPQGRLHTFCHAVPGAYSLMAVTLSAGGAFQWLRNTLRAIAPAGSTFDYEQVVNLAQQTPPGAEGLLFLPYLSGERTPHRDPLARGAFVGLTLRHGLGHMARAVMEGVIFSLRDGLTIMEDLGLPISEVRAIGGGARSAMWCQMQADIFGRSIVRMRAEEGPAFGAAILAGVGVGLYRDVQAAVSATVGTREMIAPKAETSRTYADLYAIYRQLYSSLRSTFSALARV